MLGLVGAPLVEGGGVDTANEFRAVSSRGADAFGVAGGETCEVGVLGGGGADGWVAACGDRPEVVHGLGAEDAGRCVPGYCAIVEGKHTAVPAHRLGLFTSKAYTITSQGRPTLLLDSTASN